jgi:polyisoprenyl-phosphate glycosyltransferase
MSERDPTLLPSLLPSLTLVLPCHDEEAVLEETTRQLEPVLARLVERGLVAPGAKVLYVDDGSNDATWSLITRLAEASPHVEGLKLSRNFGHQNALFAGLMHADADLVVSLDADLQDDVTVVETMVEAHHQGYDVVYGARRSRGVDAVSKRLSAKLYYKLLRAMGAEVIDDHADFRLMSRKAVDALSGFQEAHLFLRGIVPLLGFKSKVVHYERKERFAGETKYGPRKMLALALDGVTSFTSAPLKLIAWFGAFMSVTALAMSIWALMARLLGNTVPGWASIVVPLYFLGGVQILTTGVLGIYVSKLYGEVKKRPRYIVESHVGQRAHDERVVTRLRQEPRSAHRTRS